MQTNDTSLRRLEKLTTFLDTAVQVPGTKIRIGADSLIGLIPGVGDFATTILASYLVYESARLGVPAPTLIRMAGNVALDALVGAVPILGDLFDVTFRANVRNLRLLQAHLSRTRAGPLPPSAAGKRLAGIAAVLLGILILCIAALSGAVLWILSILLQQSGS